MLTEAMIFENIGRSNASDVRRLTLQDRTRLRMCPSSLTAKELIQSEGSFPTQSDADDIQDVCTLTGD